MNTYFKKLFFCFFVVIAFSMFVYADANIEKIEFKNTKITVKVGDILTLPVYVTPNNADKKSVEWFSSDSDIVEVNKSGTIEAKQEGTAIITVKASNYKNASCVVIVKKGGKKFELSGCKDVKINKKRTINASKKVKKWEISDLSVIKKKKSTAKKLKIVGKKKGKVTITAISTDNKKASCKISVVEKKVKKDKKLWVDNEAQIFSATVGYGHSYIIKSADGKLALYDIGRSKGSLSCKGMIKLMHNFVKDGNRLENNKVVFEYLFLSHYHKDHVSCLKKLLKSKNILVKNVVLKKTKKIGRGNYKKNINIVKKYVDESHIFITNGMSDGRAFNLGQKAVIRLYNTKDVFAHKSCSTKKIKIGRKSYSGKFSLIGNNCSKIKGGYYPYIEFNSKNKTFSNIKYTKNLNSLPKSNKGNLFCYHFNEEGTRSCNENANSVALLVQFYLNNKASKYAYFAGDLENNGYSFLGENYNGTKIYGGAGKDHFYKLKGGVLVDNNKLIDRVPAEYLSALKIRQFFASHNVSLNEIVFYQASHHGLNDDPASLNVLGLTNRGKDLFVAKTTSAGSNARRRRSMELLENTSVYYMFGREETNNKWLKDYYIGSGDFALGSDGKMYIVQ